MWRDSFALFVFHRIRCSKTGGYNTNKRTAACVHELTYRKNRRVCVCVCKCVCVVTYHNVWQRTVHLIPVEVHMFQPVQTTLPNPILSCAFLSYFAAFLFPSSTILRKPSTVLGIVICSYLWSWMISHSVIPGSICLYKLTNSVMLEFYREFSRTKLRYR